MLDSCDIKRSALTVLASSSGVTTERQAFMGLVKNEIDRLNASNPNKSLSMVFRAGGVTVSMMFSSAPSPEPCDDHGS